MDKTPIQEDLATVKETGNGFVLVEMIRSGSCESCGLSGLCHGQDRSITHKIQTKSHFEIGDQVRVELAPSVRIKSSLLVFIFPILSLLLFFILARYALQLSEPISILISFAGLILSGVIIYLIDKKMADAINFTIIERIGK
jgi:positive regulator of sigma E activity